MGIRQFATIRSADAERSLTHRARAAESHATRSTGEDLSTAGAALLQLQRQYGNRYVQQLISRSRRTTDPAAAAIQTKLVVGPADDDYEREADRVAKHVMRMPAVQRAQRDHEGTTGADTSGRSLPAPLKEEFETAFGADFGAVRIHSGDRAARLSRDLQAQAFTHGSDVFFGAGKYAPGTPAGKRLLAHELTHVVQQGWAPPRRERAHQAGSITPVLRTSSDAAASGNAAERIQRKLSWQKGTEWNKATKAWPSKGGAVGVLFVTDDPQDEPVIVKTGEDSPAEVLLAANFHRLGRGAGDWTIGTPGVRAIDVAEGAEIKRKASFLIMKETDETLQDRAMNIIRGATEPGTMVFEYASGEEFKDVLATTAKHAEKKTRGRRLRAESPIRLFKDPEFVVSLGRISAFDIFTANFDRLAGMYNPENFKLDRVNRAILLIDNVNLRQESPFKTFTKGDITITSDEAFNAWKQNDWAKMLRVDDFAGIAARMLDAIKDGITNGVRQKDRATIRKALDKGRDWLAQGLADSKGLLVKLASAPDFLDQLTAGMAPGDVAEVQASIKKRRAWIMGYG